MLMLMLMLTLPPLCQLPLIYNIYQTLVVIYNVMYIRHTGGIHDMIYIGDGWKCMIYIRHTGGNVWYTLETGGNIWYTLETGGNIWYILGTLVVMVNKKSSKNFCRKLPSSWDPSPLLPLLSTNLWNLNLLPPVSLRSITVFTNECFNVIQGVFYTGPPPKSSEYKKVNLG